MSDEGGQGDEPEGEPSKLAKFCDLSIADPNVDDASLAPMEIVAMVFAKPVELEKGVEYNRVVPKGKKPLNLDLRPHGLALINKVTPELLLAIVANIIATSPSARVAVARLRDEVSMWTFERSDGTRL